MDRNVTEFCFLLMAKCGCRCEKNASFIMGKRDALGWSL